ncbi:MAG: N-succinyldiaminopimelate aminotransferase [Solirubrobacteraceae bacterium]|nr:N-succinyldiaminopimelate aminotransferase [Solirubrobacteraceae bacterium]
MTAARLRAFGTTIFTEMSALAAQTGAINLGQGFPDTDGPAEIIDAVETAMRTGANQYAPLAGVPELRAAIAEHQRRRYGLEIDPQDGVQVTFGATEAIAATMLGILEPGDEVVVLEPFYDSYRATISMAAAACRPVTLRPPDFTLDLDELAAAAPGARMLLLNSPHNPTGRVATREELGAIARACVENDLIAVTDEVYEHLVFDGEHVPLATLPGMAERTLTISSSGKSFSFTGWKIGWCSGPPQLVAAVRSAKQFLSFAGGTPFQHAVATALADAERHVAPLCAALRANRDRLCEGLTAAGFEVCVPQGTYFVNADLAPLGVDDAREWCRALPERAGVVAIPTSAFYADAEAGRTLVRFAFCKRPEVIEEAVARLAAVGLSGRPPS